jgi:hypothetical protein
MDPREDENSMALLRRESHDGMGMVRLGIDLPSMEMSEHSWNKTLSIINQLALRQVQQLRFMHIGFGSLSCFMALLVIGRVWYDSWRAQQMSVRLHPRFVNYRRRIWYVTDRFEHRRWAFLYDLHPAESFPLILGFVILLQSLSFVIIQSFALQSIFVTMCKASSQIVFTRECLRVCAIMTS